MLFFLTTTSPNIHEEHEQQTPILRLEKVTVKSKQEASVCWLR